MSVPGPGSPDRKSWCSSFSGQLPRCPGARVPFWISLFLCVSLKDCLSQSNPCLRPRSTGGDAASPCLSRVSLLFALWMGGSGGGWRGDERRQGGERQKGGRKGATRSQIPALVRWRGRGWGRGHRYNSMAVHTTLHLALRNLRQNTKAMRSLWRSESPDSPPFVRPHFSSRRTRGGGQRRGASVSGQGDAPGGGGGGDRIFLRLTCFKSTALMA